MQYLPPPQEYDESGNAIPQDEDMLQEHFEDFYEDIFEELTNIGGELEQLRAWYVLPHACDMQRPLCEHCCKLHREENVLCVLALAVRIFPTT